MLSPNGHEANPKELFHAVMQQNVRKWQALGRRAEKYGPATIREAQIAVSEVLGRLHFNTAAFCGTKREQQAAIFKGDGRPI